MQYFTSKYERVGILLSEIKGQNTIIDIMQTIASRLRA